MLLLLVTFIGLGAAFTACGNHSHDAEQGKEYTSAYICPMACEGSGSEEPGKCPVCGMDYVKNENATEEGHSHDGHSHDGHDHGEHEGHNH
jgi:hypothetical protein